jgi:hypothetical protein
MPFNTEKYQIKINEDKNSTPTGGAILIPAFLGEIRLKSLSKNPCLWCII